MGVVLAFILGMAIGGGLVLAGAVLLWKSKRLSLLP